MPYRTVPHCTAHRNTRAELYKQYLMYSMSGDVVELPVGGVIRKKNSDVTRQVRALPWVALIVCAWPVPGPCLVLIPEPTP
jgi:hypothetical protein